MCFWRRWCYGAFAVVRRVVWRRRWLHRLASLAGVRLGRFVSAGHVVVVLAVAVGRRTPIGVVFIMCIM